MKAASLLGLLGLVSHATADPTWPSKIDELEEIMYQLQSFRTRKFADTISPCQTEASGPGRVNAAEWLRTGFHDMAPANSFFKRGGLDGSLQYELTSTENKGPGLRTTIEFMAPFISTKSSLSDLLALGVYASVRSCGGPAIPYRAGRLDATRRGDPGVPQPENTVLSFQQQFERMGFTNSEMIEMTACGHTIGGVHTSDFSELIDPTLVVDGQASLDRSVAAFDNKIVTEYLDGTTTNPLVLGPSVARGKNSDFKVFNSDKNVTMQALADADAFRSACKRVLQKMIEVVPPNVVLTDVIEPYKVKPVALQLTLDGGGNSLLLSGYIRVRTTGLPDHAIRNVVITYKSRDGGDDCGSKGCDITTTEQGVSQGFDDTFAFFPIEYHLPASTGISSFTVVVNYADGTSESYDNNGESYPIQDAVLMQNPQSCLLGSTGAMTITAAVRNDRVAQGAKAVISYKIPQTNSPVPVLRSATVDLVKGDCVGKYTLFSVPYTITGGRAYEARIDIVNGDQVDAFRPALDVGGTCRSFDSPAQCDDGSSTTTTTTTSEGPSSTPATEPSGSSGTSASVTASGSSDSSVSSATTSVPVSATESTESVDDTTITTTTTTSVGSTSSEVSITTTTTTTTSEVTGTTAVPTLGPYRRETVGGYELVSCWTDRGNRRTLRDALTASDDMTLEMCADFCSDYIYWGTEYSKECFCGNSLHEDSEERPLDECSTVCGGDDTQYCGNGDRLELYSTTSAPPTSTSAAAAAPTHVEAVGDYALVGCWNEIPDGRALSQRTHAGGEMTNEVCAGVCSGFRYFATQYSSECYCGSSVSERSSPADLEDCSMACAADPSSYCGGPSRLELYMNPDVAGGKAEQPLAAGDFAFQGCHRELQDARALNGKTRSGSDMTNEVCATFCADYEYFGTQYGGECYCGNQLPAEAGEADADECHMLCSGSVVEFCGAGSRLSVYKKKEDEIIAEP
jgi:hypothetical protein